MYKLAATTLTGLVGIGLAAALPPQEPGPPDGPPPHKKKGEAAKKEEPAKKAEPGPEGDLRRAYDLLRRLKADDGPSGRPDDRLRGWIDRSAGYYRRGLRALAAGDPRLAHEYGVAAHDLARAVGHARNASRFDRPDEDLPAPPPARGPEGGDAEVRRDLRHAYDRILDIEENAPEAAFFSDAARDLYNAARRDAEGSRPERARELARAAEAITHVPEHLAHAAEKEDDPASGRPRPTPKAEKADPKAKADGDDLPPPLPPRR